MLALLSFSLSVLLILIMKRVFIAFCWMDKPEQYGYDRKPIPYGMGIVFFIVFLILSVFYIDISQKYIVLMASATILTLTSFFDDRYSLAPFPRLLIQILCASAIVFAGVNVPAITNPFGDPFVLDSLQWNLQFSFISFVIQPLADTVAILWIVFVINALNWLDGSPGIVSGISTIASIVLYLLATMNDIHIIDQAALSTMALIIGASSFAFLLFDFPTPKILMGDTGTMFLGLLIAVMAMYSGGKLATAFIVLAFPILDALWTIVRRILKKQSPFRGDFQHFHHELMKAGLSEKQVNIFYYTISLGFGFVALYLNSFGKFLAILLLFLIMLSIRVLLLKKVTNLSKINC